MSIRTYFENIANAIKNVYGTTDTLTPAEMPQAITNFNSIFQTKELSSPIGTETTVEGCLSSLSSDLSKLKQVKTGTTLASLASAINAMSADEFMTSSVCINNGDVLLPYQYPNNSKRYISIGLITDSAKIYVGTYLWTDIPHCKTYTKAINGTLTTTDVSVTSWKLVYIKDASN